MTRLRLTSIGVTLLVANACLVATPETAPIPHNLRVRVTGSFGCPPATTCAGPRPSFKHDGTLTALEDDTLFIFVTDRRGIVAIPASGIAKLELYRGHRGGNAGDAAMGAGVGALVGAGLGATAGAIGEVFFGTLFNPFDKKLDVGGRAARGAAYGAGAGAVAGAASGATRGSSVWERLTVNELRQELDHRRGVSHGVARRDATHA